MKQAILFVFNWFIVVACMIMAFVGAALAPAVILHMFDGKPIEPYAVWFPAILIGLYVAGVVLFNLVGMAGVGAYGRRFVGVLPGVYIGDSKIGIDVCVEGGVLRKVSHLGCVFRFTRIDGAYQGVGLMADVEARVPLIEVDSYEQLVKIVAALPNKDNLIVMDSTGHILMSSGRMYGQTASNAAKPYRLIRASEPMRFMDLAQFDWKLADQSGEDAQA